jgi:hypothetical protein
MMRFIWDFAYQLIGLASLITACYQSANGESIDKWGIFAFLAIMIRWDRKEWK